MAGAGKMPKHNLRSVKDVVERVKVEYKTRPVRLMIDVIFKAIGTSSGREYVFNGAGSVVNVDIIDLEWFLSKRQNKGCCGGGGGLPVFELAGE